MSAGIITSKFLSMKKMNSIETPQAYPQPEKEKYLVFGLLLGY